MSRIGKNPIILPEKVEVKIADTAVSVKGPKGELSFTFPATVKFEQNGKEILVNPVDESIKARSMWGTARTIVNNMVVGVSTGFVKSLEFNGVGYKAVVTGDMLTLNLGYSHPIDFKLPQGITAKVTKNVIEFAGSNKELVGYVASKVRSFRPPEPYKGKGLKYTDETIIRKAGKTGGKK
jgi:large subunit ribosomal protein L6